MLPDKQSYAGLAGELSDYAPVVDPTTDLPAEASNEDRADVAAMTRTITRAWAAVEITAGAPVVVEHDAVWGNDNAVKPTPTNTGVGEYILTWPATVTDARGVVRSLNLQRAAASSETEGWSVSAAKASPNTAAFKTYDIAGTALADPASAVILVQVF